MNIEDAIRILLEGQQGSSMGDSRGMELREALGHYGMGGVENPNTESPLNLGGQFDELIKETLGMKGVTGRRFGEEGSFAPDWFIKELLKKKAMASGIMSDRFGDATSNDPSVQYGREHNFYDKNIIPDERIFFSNQ